MSPMRISSSSHESQRQGVHAHSQAQNVLSERTPYFIRVIDRFFGSFLGPTCGAVGKVGILTNDLQNL